MTVLAYQRSSTPAYHQAESRLDHYLLLWSAWMRAQHERLSYPSKSAGFLTGGSVQSWEDLQEQGDHYAARTMDGLISSLPIAQQCVVRSVHLGECWQFPRGNFDRLYETARETLDAGRIRWGLV